MGANARRRRDRKQAQRQRSAAVVETPVTFDPNDARALRQSCSACGSTDLEWGTLMSLAEEGTISDASYHEVAPLLGASAAAWCCLGCGEFGAFQQSSYTGQL